MMSALECIAKAAHCEAMARSCADPMDAAMLRETATHWRNLGEAAKAREAAAIAAQRAAESGP